MNDVMLEERYKGYTIMIIGICDDEKIMREQVEKIRHKVTDGYDEEILVQTYSDGSAVLDGTFDILILDIEMEDVDGISVKNIFQNRKRDTIIIFVTSHDEMMSQAFGVNVIGFVTKNIWRVSCRSCWIQRCEE